MTHKTIRRMLLGWRNKTASRKSIPSDVPSGHVAVCVGSDCTRFIVPATYLNHPVFRSPLVQAEEVYGFGNQGPLLLPCDVAVFEQTLRGVAGPDQRCCRVGESGWLLQDFTNESIF